MAAAPPGASASELERMWRSLLQGAWSSLAVVPTDPGTPTGPVTAALAEITSHEEVGALRIVDARGASVDAGERLARDLAALVAAGTRAVAAVDSPIQSLGGVPLVAAADVVLLVVRLGFSDYESVQSTIEMVGHGRILGTVALPMLPPGR